MRLRNLEVPFAVSLIAVTAVQTVRKSQRGGNRNAAVRFVLFPTHGTNVSFSSLPLLVATHAVCLRRDVGPLHLCTEKGESEAARSRCTEALSVKDVLAAEDNDGVQSADKYITIALRTARPILQLQRVTVRQRGRKSVCLDCFLLPPVQLRLQPNAILLQNAITSEPDGRLRTRTGARQLRALTQLGADLERAVGHDFAELLSEIGHR